MVDNVSVSLEQCAKAAALAEEIYKDNVSIQKKYDDEVLKYAEWKNEHDKLKYAMDESKKAKYPYIFMPDGRKINCNTYGPWTTVWGVQDCHDIESAYYTRCKACGFPVCECASDDGSCKSDKCVEYQKTNKITPEETAYSEWLKKNPEPQVNLPQYKPLGTIVCQDCRNIVEINTIEDSQIAVQQINQCINNIVQQTQFADEEAQIRAKIAAKLAAEKQKYYDELSKKTAELRANIAGKQKKNSELIKSISELSANINDLNFDPNYTIELEKSLQNKANNLNNLYSNYTAKKNNYDEISGINNYFIAVIFLAILLLLISIFIIYKLLQR